MNTAKTFVALVCVVVCMLAVSSAQAQEPPEGASPAGDASFAGQATFGGLLGLDVGLYSGGGADLALGARGGYTLPMNLYVGGSAVFDIYLGGASGYFIMVAGECGYDVSAGPVIVRPYGGLGFAVAVVSVPTFDPFTGARSSTTQTDGRFLIKLGASVLVPIGATLFAGGDASISILPGDGTFSFLNLLGTFGARF